MPGLSVWAVRLALLHFTAGTALGAVMLAGKAVPMAPWLWVLRSAHVEALLFGFVVQLVVGVGFWILPRLPMGGRGHDRPVAWALVLLNGGVALVAVAALVPSAPGLAVAGRACEALGVAAFAAHVWPRVRAVRPHA